MKYTTLGRTGLQVSRIGFGTWQLGGDWGPTDESAAISAIRRAADQGVTLFDTAQAYGFGASERLLANPNVHTAIVGTRNPGHTDDAIAAADLNLGADVLAQIDRILTAAAPTGGPTPDSV